MRILYDASRLMSRAERSAPTGVDRVCLAYAEWLLASPNVTTIPVRGRKNRLVAVEIVDLLEAVDIRHADGQMTASEGRTVEQGL